MQCVASNIYESKDSLGLGPVMLDDNVQHIIRVKSIELPC